MDLKEYIKIGYRNYKIDVWPDSFASTEEAEGEFFSKEGIIGYTTDEKRASIFPTSEALSSNSASLLAISSNP